MSRAARPPRSPPRCSPRPSPRRPPGPARRRRASPPRRRSSRRCATPCRRGSSRSRSPRRRRRGRSRPRPRRSSSRSAAARARCARRARRPPPRPTRSRRRPRPRRGSARPGVSSAPTRLVRGSIGVTDSVSSPPMNHTPSRPAAIVAASTSIVSTRRPLAGIDPGDGAVGVDRPDGAGPDGHLREAPVQEAEVAGVLARRQRDRTGAPARARVDAREAVAVQHPDRSRARCDVDGDVAQRDRRAGLPRVEVDARDRAVLEAQRPYRAPAHGEAAGSRRRLDEGRQLGVGGPDRRDAVGLAAAPCPRRLRPAPPGPPPPWRRPAAGRRPAAAGRGGAARGRPHAGAAERASRPSARAAASISSAQLP